MKEWDTRREKTMTQTDEREILFSPNALCLLYCVEINDKSKDTSESLFLKKREGVREVSSRRRGIHMKSVSTKKGIAIHAASSSLMSFSLSLSYSFSALLSALLISCCSLDGINRFTRGKEETVKGSLSFLPLYSTLSLSLSLRLTLLASLCRERERERIS